MSTDVRKHQVENHEIGDAAIDQNKRVEAIRRFLHVETLDREHDPVQTSKLLIIFDD